MRASSAFTSCVEVTLLARIIAEISVSDFAVSSPVSSKAAGQALLTVAANAAPPHKVENCRRVNFMVTHLACCVALVLDLSTRQAQRERAAQLPHGAGSWFG